MLLPGRHGTDQNAEDYRYSFQGQEHDDEVKGKGNSVSYEARIYDPRVGKWLSKDPHWSRYPYETPYSGMLNNPVVNMDPDGRDIIDFLLIFGASGSYRRQGVLLQASSIFMNWLGEFANVTGTGDEASLGISRSGSRSDINLQFALTTEDGNSGFAEITFQGTNLANLDEKELKKIKSASIDDLTLLITLKDKPDFTKGQESDAGDKLLTAIHEISLHGETFAQLLESFRDNEISIEELIEQYKVAVDGGGEPDHLKITTEESELYEGIVADVKETMKSNPLTNANYPSVVQNDPPGRNSKSKEQKLHEQFGKYRKNSEPRDFRNGLITLLEYFSYAYDWDKEYAYNPEFRGKILNFLKKEDAPSSTE